MEKNNKEAPLKPWKEEKPKKRIKLWMKILAGVLALLIGLGAFIGCAVTKNPDKIDHMNDETQVLEEFNEIGKENLAPDNISEKALNLVARFAEKDPADVTKEDIIAVFEMLRSGNSLMFDVSENGKDKNSEAVTRKEKFYNILVLGRDKVALNTDVIICASFDTKNSKAATVQIPRDSYVEDEKGVKSKINAVFARGYTDAKKEVQKLKKAASGKTDEEIAELCKNSTIEITPETLKGYISGKKKLDDICTDAGAKALQDVITRTFGIYFDYYAIVSTDAFVQIVDAVGGVDVYVQEPMHYDDPLQNLHIHIDAGQQHLDGKKAEGFVRFRSGYVQADIARMDAQKIFMTAFFKKLLSFSSLTRIDEIVKAVYNNLDTDMSIDNILAFVRPALKVDMSEITMLNMQGTPYNNGMYYSLNRAENLKIVNEHFNVFSHDLTPKAVHVIELVEGTSTGEYEGMTMEDIKDKQPHINFVQGGLSKDPEPNPQAPSVEVPENENNGETEENGETVNNGEESENTDENQEETDGDKADGEQENDDPVNKPDDANEDSKSENSAESENTDPEKTDEENDDPLKQEDDGSDESEESEDPEITEEDNTSEDEKGNTDTEAELPPEGNTPSDAVNEPVGEDKDEA